MIGYRARAELRVERDGVSLRIHDEGNFREPNCVVLLHGLGLDLDSWCPVAQCLAEAGHRVIRLDWRGHGGSGAPPTGYALADLVEDVHAVLDRLEVERAHLVGHSLGGTVAAEFALHHPIRVSSVSVLGGVVAGYPPSPTFVAWTRQVIGLLQGGGVPALLATLPDTVMYRNRAERRVNVALHSPSFVPENFASAAAAATTVPSSWDRLRSGELHAPVLFLNGVDDPAVLKSAPQIAAQVPRARGVALEHAGHLALLEQPDAVSQQLLDFFSNPPRR
ncbi:MAG: alpha/beta fold hydrolase [Sciscionella sp.]